MAATGPSNMPRSMCLSSIGTELRVTCQPWYSSRPCRAVELPRSFAPGPQSVPAGYTTGAWWEKLRGSEWGDVALSCKHRVNGGKQIGGDARLRFYRYSSQQRSHRVMALAAAIPPPSLIVTFVK